MDLLYGNKLQRDFSRFNIKDEAGNYIRVNEAGCVYIRIKSKTHEDRIGTLEWRGLKGEPHKNVLIFVKEERETNVFRSTDAWSIPSEILSRVYGVIVETEEAIYKITRMEAMENGSYLHFKTSGVERKVYIPRSCFHITKR